MTDLLEAVEKDGKPFGWLAWCTGCDNYHHFDTRWEFDGNHEKPTFSPSMKATWTYGAERDPRCCHSFLKAGVWDYLTDCTHEYAGKKLPLELCPNSSK